jgi:hypothetical protein
MPARCCRPADLVEREVVATIEFTYESCKKGVVKYNIPSIDKQREVPNQRVANENVALCEALNVQ